MKAALILLPSLLIVACSSGDGPRADAPSPQAEDRAATTPGAAFEGAQPVTGVFDDSRAGTPAPDIPLETGPDGATETIADILAANPGQPILVNLWATWCAPCLKELPTLDRLAADTRGRLLVVPISQDMEGWRRVSEAFTAERYPNLETRVESAMQFGFRIGATGLPVTILYGPDGRELWRYLGDRDWSDRESRAQVGA